MKKKLFFMIIGILLGVTIGVGASTLINSNQVGYTPSDSNWDVKSVDAAITSLYDKINYGNATAADIKSGKTALVGGKEITGTNTSSGAMNRTTLWTNPNPNQTMTTFTMSLNSSISNYDYIEFKYRRLYNESTPADFDGFLVSVSTLKKCTNANNSPVVMFGSAKGNSGYKDVARGINYVNDTTLTTTYAYEHGTTTAGTGWLLPQAIYGIKLN